ncbi:MAG TPA: ADP-ribosylglycohydrolase family protein [Gemmataceae bacterium]|nr:ADP-ribosylglycohydrolase family protein [Gemmataceae bacterium]
MLVELAVGDAYGAGFEYSSGLTVRLHNSARYYLKHPKHNIQPGCYTDDTQMTLAIVELLLSGQRWTPENLAERFVEVFWRDPREGYAGKFYEFLKTVRSGEEFLARVQPTSDKSGAAMRATPLGVLRTIGEVVEKCRVQAAVTHNTTDGINAALAAALMTHYFLYNLGPKEQLPDFLQGQVEGQWISPWFGKVEGKGWMSVRAAITAVVRNTRLSELLKDCVEFTGDVDTVATIALAAASCSPEYEHDLPASLVLELENGAYGREYLAALDQRLFEHFGLRA